MLAFHGIFSTYGFWLPNDPRGSWSKWVASWELLRFGKATKVTTTRSVAARHHEVSERVRAKQALKYEPVVFDGQQALCVGGGIEQAVRLSGYHVLACAILPEHVHVVVAEHAHRPSQIIGHFKKRSTQALMRVGLHPFVQDGRLLRSCWADQGWKVFLDNVEDVRRAIAYVVSNPEKEGKRPQSWAFVQAYEG